MGTCSESERRYTQRTYPTYFLWSVTFRFVPGKRLQRTAALNQWSLDNRRDARPENARRRNRTTSEIEQVQMHLPRVKTHGRVPTARLSLNVTV